MTEEKQLDIEMELNEEAQTEAKEEDIEVEEPQEEKKEEPEKKLSEIEERAMRMGWKPKSEYDKDPETWVGADKFLQRADEEMPLLRERLRHSDKRIEEMQKAMLDMKGLMTRMEQRGYDRAHSELEQQLAAAKADYDMDKYDQLMKQKVELEKQEAAKPQEPKPQDLDPVLVHWVNDPKNRWFYEEPGMQQQAIDYFGKLEVDSPYMSTIDKIKATEDYVKQQNPGKFGLRPKPTYSDVETTNVSTSPKNNTKSYADIPKDERQIMDNILKQMPFYGKKDEDSQKKIKQYKVDCVQSYFGA